VTPVRTARLALLGKHLALIVLLVVMLFPVYVMLKTSVTAFNDLFSWPPSWWPQHWSFHNYVEVLTGGYQFGRAYLNSAIIAVATSGIAIVLGFLAAYGLSRFRFRGRQALLFTALATQMFSPVVMIVSLYQMMRGYHLLNTYLAVILAESALAIPIALWLLHGYLESIPPDLEEAAMIDGCSRLSSLRHVVLPLAAPGIAMAGIYTFIFAWNALIFPLVFLNNDQLYPIPLAMSRFVGQNIVYWNLLMAGGILATVPVALLFSSVQGVFVRGITAGALKG